jgi:hypothetical protein
MIGVPVGEANRFLSPFSVPIEYGVERRIEYIQGGLMVPVSGYVKWNGVRVQLVALIDLGGCIVGPFQFGKRNQRVVQQCNVWLYFVNGCRVNADSQQLLNRDYRRQMAGLNDVVIII